MASALYTCSVVNIRLHEESVDIFGCTLYEPVGAFAIYHHIGKKKRRGMRPCLGVAFFRGERGPVPADQIPAHCETCGQELLYVHLDFSAVLDPPRVRQSTPAARIPRHFGAKGTPVVEVRPATEGEEK